MEKRDTSNGIAWFDNIFQTFEDMYHDVDDLVKQAESQLVAVGANVKNFFSELDLIGDAIPQSLEDKKPAAAPDTSVVQKTDGAVGIKSLVGSDGSHGDQVHIGSVESVKSVSSSLSLEQIDDDIGKKRFQLQTPDEIDSSNANQEVGLEIGAKLLIPALDGVGECKYLAQTEDRNRNLVDMSSTFSNDKINLSNAHQEIGLESGGKLLFPASDDIGGINSSMETQERSRNIVDMSSKISEEARLSTTLEIDNNLCKKSTTADIPASATEPEGLELCDRSNCEESVTTLHFPVSEERDNDVTESGLQTLGSFEKVELGESCILVDCTELESSSGEAAKHMSYKKKLKDAFASKLRLLNKRNSDEQKNSSFSMLALPEKSDSPDYEFFEADWEIV